MEHILTNENFAHEVLEAEGLVLVDFFATWCGPCKMLSPHIEKLAEENPAIKVCKLNVDEADEPTRRYGIRSIPTLIFFRGGEVVKTSVGYLSYEELKTLVEGLL